jgi:hypothetical protein
MSGVKHSDVVGWTFAGAIPVVFFHFYSETFVQE